jgi:cellobiose-specific phosphotransferase system component IIA
MTKLIQQADAVDYVAEGLKLLLAIAQDKKMDGLVRYNAARELVELTCRYKA